MFRKHWRDRGLCYYKPVLVVGPKCKKCDKFIYFIVRVSKSAYSIISEIFNNYKQKYNHFDTKDLVENLQ